MLMNWQIRNTLMNDSEIFTFSFIRYKTTFKGQIAMPPRDKSWWFHRSSIWTGIWKHLLAENGKQGSSRLSFSILGVALVQWSTHRQPGCHGDFQPRILKLNSLPTKIYFSSHLILSYLILSYRILSYLIWISPMWSWNLLLSLNATSRHCCIKSVIHY